jgi:hypothetical protein
MRPLNDNHRPLPRLARALGNALQGYGGSSAASAGQDIINAHRSGSPVQMSGPVKTGPVYSGTDPYVGRKEQDDIMYRAARNSDPGASDMMDAMVHKTNAPYDVNKSVKAAGGTKGFIADAVKNRKKNSQEEII